VSLAAVYHNRQIFIRRKYDILLQLTKVCIIFAFSRALSDAYCSEKLFGRRRRFRVYPVVVCRGECLTLIFFFLARVCFYFTLRKNSNERVQNLLDIIYFIFFLSTFIFTTEFHLRSTRVQPSRRNGSEM